MDVKDVLSQKKIWSTRINAPKKLGHNCLVRLGSVRAEIFLILTNVARTNVAWTNATVTVA